MMKPEDNRIIGMLMSGQEDLIRLGVILALNIGKQECRELFKSLLVERPELLAYGPDNIRVSIPTGMTGSIFIKNGIGILFAGTYIRFASNSDLEHAKNSHTYWNKVINLDNHET